MIVWEFHFHNIQGELFYCLLNDCLNSCAFIDSSHMHVRIITIFVCLTSLGQLGHDWTFVWQINIRNQRESVLASNNNNNVMKINIFAKSISISIEQVKECVRPESAQVRCLLVAQVFRFVDLYWGVI